MKVPFDHPPTSTSFLSPEITSVWWAHSPLFVYLDLFRSTYIYILYREREQTIMDWVVSILWLNFISFKNVVYVLQLSCNICRTVSVL